MAMKGNGAERQLRGFDRFYSTNYLTNHLTRMHLCIQLGVILQPYVSRRIALLDLPSEVQEQLMRQRITPSTAQEILSLDKQDRRELTELIIEKKVTRTEVRRFVRRVKEGIKAGPTVSYYSEAEKRMSGIDRAFARCIASLKVSMMRFDDVLDYVDEDEWVVKEMLMQQRIFIHQQIDNLLKLKRKVHRTPPPIE